HGDRRRGRLAVAVVRHGGAALRPRGRRRQLHLYRGRRPHPRPASPSLAERDAPAARPDRARRRHHPARRSGDALTAGRRPTKNGALRVHRRRIAGAVARLDASHGATYTNPVVAREQPTTGEQSMSNRKILALAFVGLFPLAAGAQQVPSVGGCGLGSKLFEGQRGVAPQVLAVTTNGTFGNQTFGISSGTLGCNQDGVVRSNWK